MKRMAMLVLVVLLMTASVYGTNTRVLTMGDNNRILLDEANINLFPSRLFDYPNLAVAEFDNDNMMELGVHWQFNKDKPWVLGTYLHNNSATTHPFAPINAPFGENKRLDLYYARNLGDHKFGFHMGLRNSSDTDEKPDDKSEASLSIWNFDLGLTPDGDDMDVSMGLEMMTFSDKGTIAADSSQYDQHKPKGNMAFYAQARKFHKMNAQCSIIPHAAIRFGKFEREEYTVQNNAAVLTQTVKNNLFEFDAGAGLEYTPASNVLAVMDFGVVYDMVKTESKTATVTAETKDKTFTLPYFKIGFDADVFRWLDVRFGATSYWNRQTIEAGTSKDKINMPDNETYLGFGFHWNRLHVDAQANPALFMDGFNFLSGRSNDMNFRLSAVYEMM
ncbi:MAG: hypothetical protein ABIE70_09455 [bacterium]